MEMRKKIRMQSLHILPALFFGFLILTASHDAVGYQSAESDSINQAIRIIEQDIETHPDSANLYIHLGMLQLAIEEWDRAKNSFEQCLTLDNTSAEAHNGLGLVYYNKGLSPILPIEALKKLFKLDNYSRAEREFKRALAINPDYLDPLYNMGVNFLAKGGEASYENAVEALTTVLECDPLFKEADLMLGVAYQFLKDFVNAETVLKRVVDAGRSEGKAQIHLSEIYLETGRNAEASLAYYAGIERLRDKKMWKDLYAEIEILMSPSQKDVFKALPISEKGAYVKRFWKGKDSDPTTVENERLVEHFRRVQFARNTYVDNIPPYYDDRGKIYVKYGKPDAVYLSQMSGEGVKDNESWSYERSIQKGLTFDFVKKGTSFYRVRSLIDASPTGSGNANQWSVTQALYVERADFSESYNQFLVQASDVSSFQNRISNFQADRDQAEKRAPVEVFHHTTEMNELPFVYNYSQFREDDGNTRVELYLGVANSNLAYKPSAGGIATSLVCRAVVQDSNFNDIFSNEREFYLRARNQNEIAGKLFLHQENMDIVPGSHLFAVQISNPQGNAQGNYRNDMTTRNFTGSALMLSDIQLASGIDVSDTHDKFTKHGLRVLPYPYNVIPRQRPIFIYFEVYNLRYDPTGRTNYTVTHTVEIMNQKRGFLSRTFGAVGRLFKKGDKAGISTSYTQSGGNSMTSEYISLDLGKLPLGQAQLTVTIEDHASGEIAEQTLGIQLIE